MLLEIGRGEGKEGNKDSNGAKKEEGEEGQF